MDEIAEPVLKLGIGHRLLFAGQYHDVFGQFVPLLHGKAEETHHVLAMDEGLAGIGVARIQPALHVAFVDAGDLVREGGHRRLVVIEAGEVQEKDRDLAAMGADDLLGLRLGDRIGPFRFDGRILADRLARLSRAMDQHRARIDEPLDLEPLQRIEQMARALDIDVIVEGVFLAGEIEIGGQMDHGGNAAPMIARKSGEGLLDRSPISKIDLDQREIGGLALPVEPDDLERVAKLLRQRGADAAGRARYQYDRLVVACHELCPSG